MADKLRSREGLIVLSAIYLLISIIVLFLPLDGLAKIFLLSIGLIFLLSLLNYLFGFFIFLFIRPLIDFTTNQKIFSFADITINLLFVYGTLMMIFSLLVLANNYQELKEKRLIFIWLVFLAWSAISLLYTFDLANSFKELSRYFSIFFSFALGAALIKKNRDLTLLIKVLIFSSLIPAFVALIQFFSGKGLIEDGMNRLYGTMAHPNMLAFYLLLPITLSFFVFLTVKKSRLETYFYLAIAIFLSFILIFTYTRGAYVALFIIILLIGFLKFRKFLLFAGLGLLFIYLIFLPFQERLNTIFQIDPYNSIGWRLNLYQDSLSYIRERPLIGQGVGSAENIISKNRDFRLGAAQPHNDYMRLALDGGIISVSIYLFLIVSLLYRLLIFYKKENRARLKMLNIFILAFAISIYAMSFGDNILNDTSLEWHFWALIGGLFAIQTIKKPAIDLQAS